MNKKEAVRLIESTIISNAAHTTGEYDDAVTIVDALLASNFCSDPVRELVKKMLRLRKFPPIKYGVKETYFTLEESELLRKIVEEE